jgi:hypothetical protein
LSVDEKKKLGVHLWSACIGHPRWAGSVEVPDAGYGSLFCEPSERKLRIGY